eukprot:Rmarinus@m.17126
MGNRFGRPSHRKRKSSHRYIEDAPPRPESHPGIHTDVIMSIVPGLKGSILTGGEDQNILEYDWVAKRVTSSWRGHTRCINSLAYGKSSELVYTCSRDLSIKGWSRSSVTPFLDLPRAHNFTISTLCLSGDESVLVSGSRDSAVCFWDPKSSKNVGRRSIPRNLVTEIVQAGAASHTLFAQASEDLQVRVWDARDQAIAMSIAGQHTNIPTCLDVSADGRYLITGTKGFDGVGCEAKLFDIRKPTVVLREFQGHYQALTKCRFLPPSESNDVPLFVTSSNDGSIRLWDTISGECLVSSVISPSDGPVTALALLPEEDDPRKGVFSIACGCFSGSLKFVALDTQSKAIGVKMQTEGVAGVGVS